MAKLNLISDKSTKSLLLEALEKSDGKNITAICRSVGVTRNAFYFHYYKDVNFKKRVLAKRLEHLAREAAAI